MLSTTYIGLHPIRKDGGDEENRTPDPLLARQVLSQLSYAPISEWMLPSKLDNAKRSQMTDLRFETVRFALILRKEVIQPHLPIRLPCYDFTPVIAPALDG